MSRTKRTPAEKTHEGARGDQPELAEYRRLKPRQPTRAKLPRGAAERRRMSYGYRTAPRQG